MPRTVDEILREAGGPQLPRQVSTDGQEIWDWAIKLSEHTQQTAKLAQLTRNIASIGMTCGDCGKWMKSRECPREHNVAGMSRGPSCKAMKCTQFVEKAEATARRQRLRDERDALATGQS